MKFIIIYAKKSINKRMEPITLLREDMGRDLGTGKKENKSNYFKNRTVLDYYISTKFSTDSSLD